MTKRYFAMKIHDSYASKTVPKHDRLEVQPISYESLGGVLLACIESLCEKQDRILVGFDNYEKVMSKSIDQSLSQVFLDIMENLAIHNPADIRNILVRLCEKNDGYEIAISSIWPKIVGGIMDDLLKPTRRIGTVARIRANQIAYAYSGEVTMRDFIVNDAVLGAELAIWLPRQSKAVRSEASMIH